MASQLLEPKPQVRQHHGENVYRIKILATAVVLTMGVVVSQPQALPMLAL